MSKKMAKTQRGFFSQCRDEKLYRKTFRKGGVSWNDFKSSPNDYYAANTGAVSGMIYYKDTIPFGKKHLADAMVIAAEYGYGTDFFLDGSEIDFNKVAWFLWEVMAGDLISYLEDED